MYNQKAYVSCERTGKRVGFFKLYASFLAEPILFIFFFFSVDTLYAHTDISKSLASGAMCLKTPNVNIHSYPRSVGHPLESARIYYPWTLLMSARNTMPVISKNLLLGSKLLQMHTD